MSNFRQPLRGQWNLPLAKRVNGSLTTIKNLVLRRSDAAVAVLKKKLKTKTKST